MLSTGAELSTVSCVNGLRGTCCGGLPSSTARHAQSMTDFHSTYSNSNPVSSIPKQGITLGANPGELMAALPAMMGFTPSQCLVIIGIVPDTQEPHRLRIGPVIRLDLENWALREAIGAFTEALAEWPAPQALVYGIHPRQEGVEDFINDAALLLEEDDVAVISTWWIEAISEGARWIDLETLEVGAVSSIDDNPLSNFTALHGALSLSDREELEQWMDVRPDAPVLRPRRFENSLYDREECAKLLADLLTVTEATAKIHRGDVRLESALADRSILRAICCIARDERLSTYLIALGLGDRAPIVREFLVEAARHSRSFMRRRLLLILSAVLSNNDEGMPAFYALREVARQSGDQWCDSPVDRVNRLIVDHMWRRHMSGTAKNSNIALAVNGVYWAANWETACLLDHDEPFASNMESVDPDQESDSEFRCRHRALLELLPVAIDWRPITDEPNAPYRREHW